MPTEKLMHITETYRDDADSRLVRVEAYYRNDKPNGVGVMIKGGDLAWFDAMMRDYEEAWEEADAAGREHIVGAYFRQLEAWGMTPAGERSVSENRFSAVNIAFLERHNFVEGDRYNGCRFTYDVDPDRLCGLL